MIGPGTGVRVSLPAGVTDMKRGIEGLSMLAQDGLASEADRWSCLRLLRAMW